jgi:hypothetical protein
VPVTEDKAMKKSAFKNVINQIGYCGLWCGSCGVGNGAMALAAKRFHEIYEGYGVHDWGPKDFEIKEFRKGLKSLAAMEGCRGCLKDDGNPRCPIRPCARERGISDCSECEEQHSCAHREFRDKLYKGARAVWMIVKTEEGDREGMIGRWTDDLRLQWPACVLFLEEKDPVLEEDDRR